MLTPSSIRPFDTVVITNSISWIKFLYDLGYCSSVGIDCQANSYAASFFVDLIIDLEFRWWHFCLNRFERAFFCCSERLCRLMMLAFDLVDPLKTFWIRHMVWDFYKRTTIQLHQGNSSSVSIKPLAFDWVDLISFAKALPSLLFLTTWSHSSWSFFSASE